MLFKKEPKEKKAKKEKKEKKEISPEFKKKKKIALTALLIVALLAAAGYLGYIKFQEHTKKTIITQAMRSKYGKIFTVDDIVEVDEENYYAYLKIADIEGGIVKAYLQGGGTKLEDDYVTVRLCHTINEEVEKKLPKEEYFFVHTDNALEYTDAGEFSPETVSVTDYLKSHPSDEFIVSILVDSSKAVPEELRNMIGAMAYSLKTERGSLNMYSVSHEAFEELKKGTLKRDSMKRDVVKEYMQNEAKKMLTLSFEEINPPSQPPRAKAPGLANQVQDNARAKALAD